MFKNEINNLGIGMSSSSHYPSSDKKVLDTIIKNDTVEIIYKEDVSFWTGQKPQSKIYKEIIKYVDGKMQVVNTIRGKYFPTQEERYEF